MDRKAIIEQIGRLKSIAKKKKASYKSAAHGLVSGIEQSLQSLDFKNDKDYVPVPTKSVTDFIQSVKEADRA